MDQSTINFAIYEDGKEFLGMAKVTLPDLTALTQSVSGAGIGGNMDAIIIGHYDAMTLGLNFRTTTEASISLAQPRRHNLDLRVAQQDYDTVGGALTVRKVKHVFVVVPKSTKGGTVAPASPTDGSGEYAVYYWAAYIDGKKKLEIDQANLICLIDGVDYLAEVRKALGK